MTSAQASTPSDIASERPHPAFASINGWCGLSGMSRSGTYIALKAGNLTARKLGGRTLVDVEAGLRWLRSLPSAYAA